MGKPKLIFSIHDANFYLLNTIIIIIIKSNLLMILGDTIEVIRVVRMS